MKNLKEWIGEPAIKWWKLKGGSLKEFRVKIIEKGPWNIDENTEEIRNTMASCIRNAGKGIIGETKGGRRVRKETWQWNDEVQNALWVKKCFFKSWQKSCHIDDWKHYIETWTEAKIIMREAKLKAYEDFYKKLSSKGGEIGIYKFAKL